ncbi:MAG: hypothetical protein MJ069_01895 [Salinivirgaceae bacterium]|nr:hypothetical protein [Salinivirgaceae bacterium]
MKRFILIFATAFCFFSASAQNENSKYIVQIGLGDPKEVTDYRKFVSENFVRMGKEYYSNPAQRRAPIIVADGYVCYNKFIQLGTNLIFYTDKRQCSLNERKYWDSRTGTYINNDAKYDHSFRANFFAIMASAKINYLARENMNMYVSGSVGVALFSAHDGVKQRGAAHFNFLGINYGKQLFGFVELGYGCKGIANVGIGYRL